MGILNSLIDDIAQKRTGAGDAPKGDDTTGVTDRIWAFLFPNSFSKITKENIIDAIGRAYPDVDAVTMLANLNALERYAKTDASKAQFTQLLRDILSNIDRYKVAKSVKALGKIRPGGSIAGGTSGSIGGFLINNDREIFLFGDGHVLTRTMNAPVSKVTPQILKDKITKNNVDIGVVVCSSQIQVGGTQNYDMALVKIEPKYYDRISLEYRPSKGFTNSGKSFFVTKVDDNLSNGKPVFLYGHTSGYRAGKLLTCNPADVTGAPYGRFIGAATNQNITIHGCIKVESVDNISASLEGDSGALWVSDKGEAVGIQIMNGHDDLAWVHPMKLVMDYFHSNYDGSLRFLAQSDLPKPTGP
jgi:hypothetical protein